MPTQTFSARLTSAGYEPVDNPGMMLVRSQTPLKRGDNYEGHPILGTFTLSPNSEVYNARGKGPFVGITFTNYQELQRLVRLPGVILQHGWPLIDEYTKREGGIDKPAKGFKLVTVYHTPTGKEVRLIHLVADEQGVLSKRVNLKGAFDNDGNPVATDPNSQTIEKELFDVEVKRVLDSLSGN